MVVAPKNGQNGLAVKTCDICGEIVESIYIHKNAVAMLSDGAKIAAKGDINDFSGHKYNLSGKGPLITIVTTTTKSATTTTTSKPTATTTRPATTTTTFKPTTTTTKPVTTTTVVSTSSH